MVLADYRIVHQLHVGRNSRVVRAVAGDGIQPVIVKSPHSAYPTPREIERLRHEHAILQQFASPLVIKAHAIEREADRVALVLEDIQADSLSTLIAGPPVALADGLWIACAAAEALEVIHAARVVHRDVNPSNLIVNLATRQLQLIDFGLAALLPRQPQQSSPAEAFEGTLTYIAPEQTGRMNRAVDFRTDLYSLGATLYELFTGRPPFQSADALELIHAHIARPPQPPRELRPDLPPALAAIVLKLLAKNAEDRYQTAAGLRADLEVCREQLAQHGTIADFPLGLHDRSDRFALSEQLRGREGEVAALLAAFERASAGPAELLLVAGYSGVGKSRLVHEVQPAIVERRGHFVASKFDQLKRNQPFSCLFRAFGDLIRQILAESDEQVQRWRGEVAEAVGRAGQVLVAAIPELELLLGPQPPVDELPPDQARNRFGQLFRRFVQLFCRPAHPLCIFLDDLQWVDSATLQWIEQQLGGERTGHLLLIGAYRDNEVSPAHPLSLALDRLRAAGAGVTTLSLPPLSKDDVGRLIADSLATPPAACAELVEIVYAKTGGNPFFTNQCLLTLYEEGAISFDPQARAWGYDAARARQARISDNVVELLAGQIGALHPDAQHVLKVAACVGSRFDRSTLARILGVGHDALGDQLDQAVVAGLLVRLHGWSGERAEPFAFLHDRVQQAALSLLAPAELQRLRLQIGRLLYDQLAAAGAEDSDEIFVVADHLNSAAGLIDDPQEHARLARLNLAASRRAKQATAFEIARDYSARALEEHRRAGPLAGSAMPILTERAECLHLCGNNPAAERLYDEAVSQPGSPMEKMLVYERKIHFYTNQARFADAYATGRAALQLVGTQLPAGFVPPLFVADVVRVRLQMRKHTIPGLVDLPRMEDRQRQVIVRIMAAVAKAAFQLKPQLCIHTAAKIVGLCLEHGNIGESVIGYVAFGAIFQGAIMGDHKAGYAYGRACLALVERYQNSQHRAEIHFVVGYFATSWLRPVAEAEQLWQKAYEAGLESGDLFHATCAAIGTLQSQLMRGVPLDALQQQADQYLDFLTGINSQEGVATAMAVRQTARNLRGLTRARESFSEQGFDEAAYTAGLAAFGSRHFAHYYLINKMQTLYLWQRHREGLALAKQSASYLSDSAGMLHSAEHYLYHALLLAALYEEAGPAQRGMWLRQIQAAHRRFQTWAKPNPANFRHKERLLAAELARLRGAHAEASEAYVAAAAAAAEHGYLQIQGLANELAARLHERAGRHRLVGFHLQEAAYAYSRWGADAYLAFLIERYPQHLAPESQPAGPSTTTGSGHRRTSTSGSHGGSLDLDTVLKASETIAAAIELPDLLRALMTIIIENAGAQRGVLILRRDQQLLVQAEGQIDADLIHREAIPLADYPDLPQSLISYVARVREPLVLGDAAHEGGFTQDPYITWHQPRSVLCQPLVNQGQLAGLLYLENNLASGAFTPARLRLLTLLSSQAAIAIEKTQLYGSIQASERKYRTLFADSRDSIFIAGLDDRIIDINPAGAALLRPAGGEMAGSSVADLYAHPADHARFTAAISGGGSVKDFEAQLRTGDGRLLDCMLTATLRYDEDGNRIGYQGIIRDITAQRRAEQERLRLSAIERELSVATALQQSMLPPSQPDWPELPLFCASTPAREVGGDFYSYHRFSAPGEPGRYALAVGDLTGKGVGAALLMATALSQFDASLALSLTPAERMAHLDAAIMPYTRPRRQNCGLCYLELTRQEDGGSRIEAINAGGIPPYLKRADGSVEFVELGGFALGQGFGQRLGYQSRVLEGAPGDLIILTSDGVVEANDAADAMFGFDRLAAAIEAGPSGDAAAMLAHLQQTLAGFVGATEPHDDMTIMVVGL